MSKKRKCLWINKAVQQKQLNQLGLVYFLLVAKGIFSTRDDPVFNSIYTIDFLLFYNTKANGNK